ncbi:hypothetical protein OMR07_08555 [Methylobacterium organophilum]|nr:hypothetical protein [Methylobacterium organophilum]
MKYLLATSLVVGSLASLAPAALALVLAGIACAERLKPAPVAAATPEAAYSQTRTRRM